MNLYLDLAMQMEAVTVFTALATPLLCRRVDDGMLKLLTATAQDFIRRLRTKLDGDEEARMPAGMRYSDTRVAIGVR
jgi:hypothetical protein